MDVDVNDPVQVLLGELRRHAQIFQRYRAVMPHGAVKGISLTDALDAVAEHGGHVDRSEVWLLTNGAELLGPWEPIQGETS